MSDTLSMKLKDQQRRALQLLDRVSDFLDEHEIMEEDCEIEHETDVKRYSQRRWTECDGGEVFLQWDVCCNEIDPEDGGEGDPECATEPERFYEVSVSLGVGNSMVQIHHNDDHGESGWYTDHGDLDADLTTLAARFPDGDLTEATAFEFIEAMAKYFADLQTET